MKAPDAPIKEFEREVERIFEALGYAVSSQVLIAGRPVDLIIQKSIEPGIVLRTIVECHQRDRKKATSAELTDNVNGEILERLLASREFSCRGGRDSMLRDVAAGCGLESHSGRTLLSYRRQP